MIQSFCKKFPTIKNKKFISVSSNNFSIANNLLQNSIIIGCNILLHYKLLLML